MAACVKILHDYCHDREEGQDHENAPDLQPRHLSSQVMSAEYHLQSARSFQGKIAGQKKPLGRSGLMRLVCPLGGQLGVNDRPRALGLWHDQPEADQRSRWSIRRHSIFTRVRTCWASQAGGHGAVSRHRADDALSASEQLELRLLAQAASS